jgi:putative transposase
MPRHHRELELDVHRARSTVYTLHTDLLFVTNYRRPVVTDPMLTCCEHLMREVCTGVGAALRCSTAKPTMHTCPCTTHPTSPYRCWQPGSKACRLADCASNTRCTFKNACGASTSGHRPTFAAYCGGAPLTVTKQYIEHHNRPD